MGLSGLKNCGLTPGAKTKLRIAPLSDFNGWPQTRAEVVLAAAGIPAQGDTMILDEPFDFSTAPTGEGYWREYDIVVDSGDLTASLQGEPGAGQSFQNQLPFYLSGTSAERLEFANTIKNCCEGFAAMIVDKDDTHYVIGEPGLPVFPVTIEVGLGKASGDKKGGDYVLQQSSGTTFKIYDAATHGVDVTPNA